MKLNEIVNMIKYMPTSHILSVQKEILTVMANRKKNNKIPELPEKS